MVRHCRIDPARLAPLVPCMQLPPEGEQDPYPDFRLNTISKQAVAYSCGAIAMRGAPVRHEHDREELELCRRLAAQAAHVMGGAEVGMGSEATAYFSPFFVAANVGDRVPARLTGRVIRRAFGGTIYPPARIWVEPLRERGEWWARVLHDCGGYEGEEKEHYLKPWRKMMRWFRDNGRLHGVRFVMVGDNPLDEEEVKNGGCVFPRLALGLTAAGSLAGICGHVVHT